MDISLEFDDDIVYQPQQTSDFVDNSDEVIKQYLRGRIEDLKLLSEISQNNLKEVQVHQNQCLQYLKETEQFDGVYVNIKNCWQRIYNGKWIIGVRVENTGQRSTENPNIILKCDPKQDLEYSVKIYTKYKEEIPEELIILEENKNPNFTTKLLKDIKSSFENPPKWISTEKLEKSSTIIIVLDIPKFIEYKEFELHGILSFEMCNKTYQKQLPKLSLQVQKIITNELSVKQNSVISGSEEDFLSILSTNLVTPVKIIIPEGLYRTLEGILQLDCSFTKTDIAMIFIFDGNSHNLSCSILKLKPGEHNVELITKNNEQLHMLYHHLYTHIPDVIIINENCEQIVDNLGFLTRPTQSFLDPVKQDQSVLNDFIRSFDQQLILLENQAKNNESRNTDKGNLLLCETKEDYKVLRHKLSDLEKKTEELFLKVFDKKV